MGQVITIAQQKGGSGKTTLAANLAVAAVAAGRKVQLLKPNVVHVAIPKRTLNDEAELQSWLSEVEALIRTKLKSGPVSL